MKEAIGSLMFMVPDIEPDVQGSIPNATKDPLEACDVRTRKIRGSENSLVVNSLW